MEAVEFQNVSPDLIFSRFSNSSLPDTETYLTST